MLLPAKVSPTFPLLLLLSLLASASVGATLQPQPRSYSTHDYFSLETSETTSLDEARLAALSIGTELVEQVGELAGHWLVRTSIGNDRNARSLDADSSEMKVMKEHPVVERWRKSNRSSPRHAQTHRTSQHTRSTIPSRPRSSSSSIISLSHLPIKKRSKRIFPPSDNTNLTFIRRDDLTELTFAQTTLGLHDPILNEQWHLFNTEMKEVELNVTGLWARGVTGKGVKVALIDDGLDMHSDDLADNFFAEGSWDFNDHTALPEPRLSDDQHGTRCAGEIAAVPNDVCGVGVAYESKVAGIRILSGPISDADEAAALNYEYQKNEIYSCSWGPPDDGRSMDAPEGLILKAFVNGIQKGRDGKGSIFVFAAGNGGGMDDQCNFDGYTNSIFTMSIGAIDRKGLHPYYSELCAAMLAVAPSSGSGDHIHTTDVGKDKCTGSHGGTSAAAPLAVGVIALALQVRPDLTWRDTQHLMVHTSQYFSPEDPDWEKTSVGRMFSYKYGYGRIDAGAFVEAAESWTLKKPQAWFDSPAVMLPETAAPTRRSVDHAGRVRQEGDVTLEDGESPVGNDGTTDEIGGEDSPFIETPKSKGSFITENGIESSYTITQEMLDDLNFEKMEHMTVRVWIEHERRGDVEVQITSPNGIVSVMARQRRFDDASTGFNGWKFMSMKHWDENPVGTWTINVKDAINADKVGYFHSWSLQLWGEVVDASKAKTWTLPVVGGLDEEQTGSEPTGTDVSQKPKPTEHLPDDHGTAEGESDQPGLANPSNEGDIEEGESSGSETDIDEGISESTSTASAGSFYQDYIPSLDTLKQNSHWAIGAFSLIVLSLFGSFALCILRSRRRRDMLKDLITESGQSTYRPVSEDVPMGILDRGRQKLMGARGHGKDVEDAFAYEQSESGDSEIAEREPLRYHDSFLEDENAGDEVTGGYKDVPSSAGEKSAGQEATDVAVEGEEEEDGAEEAENRGMKESGSDASTSSWQEASPSPLPTSPHREL